MEENFRDEQEKRHAEMQKAREQEQQVRSTLKQIMEPAAFERLQNIRMSNATLYGQLSQTLIYLVQSDQLKGRVSEDTLKRLLTQVLNQRKPTKITFSRK